MVRFGKNGNDATTAAVRLARHFTGKKNVLFCGYHSWQDWYVGKLLKIVECQVKLANFLIDLFMVIKNQLINYLKNLLIK